MLSDEEIRANLITFISAGHETTANALTWALYLLTLSKPWRQRVVEEARAAGGEAEKLTATRAVVEESLRLYPPLAAISRELVGPDELAGRHIGAGALVVIAPYVLHRHRLLWERPDAFDPTRFLPENRAAIPRYSYMPFGAGPVSASARPSPCRKRRSRSPQSCASSVSTSRPAIASGHCNA